MDSALSVLSGKALWEGEQKKVFVRLAECDGSVWLDLMNDKWQVVEITATGWTVHEADHPLPVKFRRPTGGKPLPIPASGGKLDELRKVCNIKDDTDWRLIVSWLLGVMNPSGPYPALILNGQQGSAKSVMSRYLRSVLDPVDAPLRSQPRTDQELMIWAVNSWVVCINNLSHITRAQSDSLARLATGGGFSARELYSDAKEFILDACRPILLNGIDDFVMQPDLLDRAIWVMVPPIERDEYRSERSLDREFNEMHPRVLGALCDACSAALACRGTITTGLPRMADFAAWVMGAESTLGWGAGEFRRLYEANRHTTRQFGLGAEPIIPPLMRLLEHSYSWLGTPQDLLTELNNCAWTQEKKDPAWPTNPIRLSNSIRRAVPALTDQGVTVDTKRGKKRMLQFAYDPKKSDDYEDPMGDTSC
jgi:hypothetical protein